MKNIKILLCGHVDLPPPLGGYARRLLNYCSVLSKKGVTFHILLFKKKENIDLMGVPLVIHYILDTPNQKSKIGYIPFFIQSIPKQIIFFLRHPQFVLKMIAKIFTFWSKGCFKLYYVLSSLLYCMKLYNIIKDEKIDIVYPQYAFELSLFPIEVSKMLQKPVIIETFAETIFWKEKTQDTNKAKVYKPFFRYIFNNVDYITGCGNHCLKGAEQYVEKDIPRKAIFSGVDIEKMLIDVDKTKLKKSMGYCGNKIVLFVNRLDWTKGPQYLIKAAPYVIEKVKEVKFVLVGRDAGLRSELDYQVKRQEINKHVIFPGVISDEELKKYYAAADVLVFPSTTDRECEGLSMEEAMISRTPVIAFDIGGISDVIVNNSSGYLVPVGDIHAFEQKIVKILLDDKLRRRLGVEAQRRAIDKFDTKDTANQRYKIFLELICSNKV